MNEDYVVLKAPPMPEDPIKLRRWWNQICIDSFTYGFASGCDLIDKPYKCNRCRRCTMRDDMRRYPEKRFIGFTIQQEYPLRRF